MNIIGENGQKGNDQPGRKIFHVTDQQNDLTGIRPGDMVVSDDWQGGVTVSVLRYDGHLWRVQEEG